MFENFGKAMGTILGTAAAVHIYLYIVKQVNKEKIREEIIREMNN